MVQRCCGKNIAGSIAATQNRLFVKPFSAFRRLAAFCVIVYCFVFMAIPFKMADDVGCFIFYAPVSLLFFTRRYFKIDLIKKRRT